MSEQDVYDPNQTTSHPEYEVPPTELIEELEQSDIRPVHKLGLLRILKANHPSDEAEFGRAVGYPESAVQGYINDDVLSPDEIDGLALEPELKEFIQIRLSRKHWQEELEEIRRQLEAVRKVSPTILKQFQEEVKE